MGAGIVQVAATSKLQVTMVDVNQEALKRGEGYILSSLKRVAVKKVGSEEANVKKFVDDVMANIKTSTDACSAAESSDLVVEGTLTHYRKR